MEGSATRFWAYPGWAGVMLLHSCSAGEGGWRLPWAAAVRRARATGPGQRPSLQVGLLRGTAKAAAAAGAAEPCAGESFPASSATTPQHEKLPCCSITMKQLHAVRTQGIRSSNTPAGLEWFLNFTNGPHQSNEWKETHFIPLII